MIKILEVGLPDETGLGHNFGVMKEISICIGEGYANRTLNSDTIDEIFDLQNSNQFSECSQNPDGFYRQTCMGFQRNLSGAYGQSYSMGDYGFHRDSQYNINGSYNQKTSVASFQISKRCYSGIVNSQVPCYSQPNEKSDKAGEQKGLLEELNAICMDQKLKEVVEFLGLAEQSIS
ncbi:unnamed protein product [Lactuca saligna]|uniref:Uncharacterized protein n=1 Tax=Lactuca saligna TaxID=75948 RepID=A0AA35Y9U7_LACSI|nr:unnamed protein product [Lactuca saligna]